MAETTPVMKLVFVVIDEPALLDDIITGFLDVGVRGATVIDSRGMAQIIRQDMPVFAGLAGLFPETTGNRTIFSVVPEELVDEIFELVQEIMTQKGKKNSAFCFTLPVERSRTIKREEG